MIFELILLNYVFFFLFGSLCHQERDPFSEIESRRKSRTIGLILETSLNQVISGNKIECYAGMTSEFTSHFFYIKNVTISSR